VGLLHAPTDERPHHDSVCSPRRSCDLAVTETTEIRWFATGALPREVRSWFVGPTATIEERCDRYLLDGRADVGVKFRNGETLELKARLALGPAMELTGGPTGVTERWRKWTFADGLVERSAAQRWVDVDKWIAKRRFSLDGDSYCDAEIVAVRSDGEDAWSFAVAAYGPPHQGPSAIRAAWRGLSVAGAPPLCAMEADGSPSMGYPEWLDSRCR
jgi:hypothetical protein